MSATIEEVLALANMNKWIEEQDIESTSGMCHNACAWLTVQIKKAGLCDYNIHWCVGLFHGKDHGWLLVENLDGGQDAIVDMTVDQFVDVEVPYCGPAGPGYEIRDSIILCNPDQFEEFIDKLGM